MRVRNPFSRLGRGRTLPPAPPPPLPPPPEGNAPLFPLRPEAVFLAGGLAWLALYLVAPLRTTIPFSMEHLFFVLLCGTALTAGAFLGRKAPAAVGSAEPSPDRLRRALLLCLVLGGVGLVFKVVDRAYLRPLSFSALLFERRDLILDSGANWVSAVGAFCFPFSYVAYFLSRTCRRKGIPIPRGLEAAGYLLMGFPVVDGLLLGSRSALLFWAYLLWSLRVPDPARPPTRRLRILQAGFLLALLLTASALFAARVDEMGFDLEWSVNHSVYAETLKPDPEQVEQVRDVAKGTFLPVYLTLVHYSQYYLHGLLELRFLMDDARGGLLWGVSTFPVHFKLFAVTFGLRSPDDLLREALPRYGVFTSLLGPLYMDFRWGAALAMGVLGLAAGLLWTQVRAGRSHFTPLHAFCNILLFLWPVVSVASFGSGAETLTAFAISPLFFGAPRLPSSLFRRSGPRRLAPKAQVG